jgi:hypothetical protein
VVRLAAFSTAAYVGGEPVPAPAPHAPLVSDVVSDPVALARRYLDGADIVVAEGYKHARVPKVEVYRPDVGPPLYDAGRDDAGDWLGIVTDDPAFRAGCPVLRFGDTAWLPTLATLAWDGALAMGA